ncbi:MAG: hypothetical protein CM1200mP21_02750 [Candidatus Poseidoniales archaeon]|nr:MAG: hypothetical protein CM1200mP21_02750 [Candidatus Poseidoniales archaeon]
MSESKSPDDNDTEGIDELATLRAQHALSASSNMESVARARERLDEESESDPESAESAGCVSLR